MDLIDTYLTELEQVIHELSRADVRAVAQALLENWRARRQLFIIGNGGSAATASHMMNDMNKFTNAPGKHRFRCIALTDNVPLLTAVGNDQSYAEVFVEPLLNLLQPGDTVLAISASGNSPNIIRAVEHAQANGAKVIGFTGRPGGQLAQMADLKIVIPSDRIGQQEDGHMILDHVLSLALREMIKQAPDS
jgi:D-sedoheptulose 7-phosphate isomerase